MRLCSLLITVDGLIIIVDYMQQEMIISGFPKNYWSSKHIMGDDKCLSS